MAETWLHICITCQPGTAEAEPCAGRRLHDAALVLHQAAGPDPVRIAAVTCLANCERGCSASLSAPGKWSYLVGGLRPEQAADLLAYARAYAAAATGTVLRSGRPAALAQAIVGRVPPPGPATPTLARSRQVEPSP